MRKKNVLCVLLALAMLLGGIASAEAARTEENANSPTVYSHDGHVTLVDGACVDSLVVSFDDAASVVESMIDQLSDDGRIALDPWRELTDAYGNRYFVFQQMHDNTTVLGGAVKVITDADGTMIGLTSSIVSGLPEAEDINAISAEQAEGLVLAHAAETSQQTLSVLPDLTDRMILPTVYKDMDLYEVEEVNSRYVWVVYTDNPDSALARSSELPYLAHYVTLSGEYLYSLPTIIPGDEAGNSGFDVGYVFEFMEPVDYTGYVDLSTGQEMELTVTVMRDKRTGMYYLGDPQRRIVVADCWEFMYNGNRVVLEYSPDNLEWDQVGLLSLYNYARAYDYYKAIGWVGGDGLGTPMLILNNFCDLNHKPVDNAAYAGDKYLGWQIFLASQANDFSQCLDVLGHEFTHCVTQSVMTHSAYMNDYGAINEAISDIQGKTCEMLTEGRENVTWLVGDKSTVSHRNMSDPHQFHQPEYTWDLYYQPNVNTPTILNDEGGVHFNSSLLNRVAWLLYEKGGMTLEEGRAFWFTVDCAMVPGADYPQMAELLPWALKAAGLEKYAEELQLALEATRLGVEGIPDEFDEGRALLTLRLPENGIFVDEQWVMNLYTVNVDKFVESALNIITHVKSGDLSVLPAFIQDILGPDDAQVVTEPAREDKGFLQSLLGLILRSDDEAEAEPQAVSTEETNPLQALLKDEILPWWNEYFPGVFYSALTNVGQDGNTMRLVCLPGHSVPLLMHGIYDDNTSSLKESGFLVYLGGQWIDLGGSPQEREAGDAEEHVIGVEDVLSEAVNRLADNMSDIRSLDDALDLFFYRVEGGKAVEFPNAGLESITPALSDSEPLGGESDQMAKPRKSRPKQDPAMTDKAA